MRLSTKLEQGQFSVNEKFLPEGGSAPFKKLPL
jgi:hypothetical protein